MRRNTFVAVVAALVMPVVLRADEPAAIPPERVVGSVLGKAVTAGDVGLVKAIDVNAKFDARDKEQWERMGRIQTVLGQPIVDRFVKERKLEATEAELQRFHEVARKLEERNIAEWQERIDEIKKELAAPDLAGDKRSDLQLEQVTLENLIGTARKSLEENVRYDEVARPFILAWKTERELHKVYGGGVIFQQLGPEALDARRLLFEEAEKKGDLKFENLGVRRMFYYYANMNHPGGVQESDIFEKTPWFFEEPE